MKYSEMTELQKKHLRDTLSLEQSGLCAVCGRRRKLVLDHNHDTDETRRALCTPCNTLLGKTLEAPGWLLWLGLATAYVEGTKLCPCAE